MHVHVNYICIFLSPSKVKRSLLLYSINITCTLQLHDEGTWSQSSIVHVTHVGFTLPLLLPLRYAPQQHLFQH